MQPTQKKGLTKERFIFAAVIILLLGVIVFGALWFNSNYVLIPIEREKVENVETCIDNDVACSLIYKSTDEIPD